MADQVLTAASERHRELLDELLEEVAAYNPEVDRDRLERAFVFASEAHEGQQRRSGEDFILHPLGVAKILAELGRDDATLAAALIHDVVEDTRASVEEVRAEFGEEVANLVQGVTKLTRIKFQSREQAQAENYRKMVMAMAEDYRVILIKLADRLHNMRTIEYLGKQKQLQKARETLEVYAPLAHRLGIHTIKWELEDLAFQTLHPRKYSEIEAMVNQRRADREKFVQNAGKVLKRELDKVGIPADISSRAKHFYSIYEKMAKRAKGKKAAAEQLAWMKQLADWQREEPDQHEFRRAFPELASDEVYVYTPKGELKNLPAGSTPIDFAYSVHTDVGHRTVGAKVNGRIVPLHYRLQTGDFVEILTSKQAGRGPSRDWLSLAASSRARNKIRQWFTRETRGETEQRGRETLEQALKQHNLPYKKLAGSQLLAQVIREMGFKKAEDFYLALGSGKLQVSQVTNKVLHRLKTEEAIVEEPLPVKPKAREAVSSQNFGIVVPGVDDVLVRLAKCCTPVPGDAIAGYISLGKGITIHRKDCPNVKSLMRNPERFTDVAWDGGASQSFRVQIAVVSWDRARLLEDVARTFAEHGANIVEYGGHVEDQMAKNWYVAEVGDMKALRGLLNALRNVDDVFDAFRVTPS